MLVLLKIYLIISVLCVFYTIRRMIKLTKFIIRCVNDDEYYERVKNVSSLNEIFDIKL